MEMTNKAFKEWIKGLEEKGKVIKVIKSLDLRNEDINRLVLKVEESKEFFKCELPKTGAELRARIRGI